MKYVLVSGGVISGIGKGIIASSTGLLCQSLGYSVTSIKIDPYLNVDAGLLAPTEHGEVFVLDDGGEVDLDLGNYERYLGIRLTKSSNITTGKIYQHVIGKERKGDYLGKTVQVVPHLTDAIQNWIEQVARVPVDDTKRRPDVCIIELGGTTGDNENKLFIEAMRQLRRQAGSGNFLHIQVSYVPDVHGEQKTKPTQQAMKDVRSDGLSPDIIACRCSTPLEKKTIEKIAMFCQVEADEVVAVHDVESTYHVPMLLEEQGLKGLLVQKLELGKLDIEAVLKSCGEALWKEWKILTGGKEQHYDPVKICLVGKYTEHHDSYLSVIKALEHAAMACCRKLNLILVDSSHLELEAKRTEPIKFEKAWHEVRTTSGMLIPGGFGDRGTEGMIAAAKWARTNKVPYLGICLGMQISVIEFARHVLEIPEATSSEFNTSTTDPIIIPMEELDKEVMGGTMRLGLQPTFFQPNSEWSLLYALYSRTRAGDRVNGNDEALEEPLSRLNSMASDSNAIYERHRHRYEVNPAYIDRLAAKGLQFVGRDEKGLRMEIIELEDKTHPYYVGVQFHPEYLSRVLDPSPPFLGLIAASSGMLEDMVQRAMKRSFWGSLA